MKIAVTGANGFLGWHTRCTLRARGGYEVVAITRDVIADPARFQLALSRSDVVIHIAGVNRAPDDLLQENVSLAKQLTDALDRAGEHPAVVYANSIQGGSGSPFGQTKQAAADHLTGWGHRTGTPVADVRLPNLFGEQSRPHYNSVVATFCYELAHGGTPTIVNDREIPLLHVQDAVDQMLDLADKRAAGVFQLEGSPTVVSALMKKLIGFHDLYLTGQIPDIGLRLDRALFNTYRSFCFPDHYPIRPTLRSDSRGDLFECLRSHGSKSLAFCSTSNPGVTRGEHFHLRKIERFLVLRGTGVIALRRLFDHRIVRFAVSGGTPAIIDMPTMWTHSITNVGVDELLTLFWADEILDAEHPDTYPERVELAKEAA
jgi:UDP-2-acetamido-2,6-beta-L-arabino-hexul-4-ose reductase